MAQRIDYDKCTGCELCVEACPSDEFTMVGGKPVATGTLSMWCVDCGHCMMICPRMAIEIDGFSWVDFDDAPRDGFDVSAFRSFLKRRRSIRLFTEREVPRAVIDEVLAMTSTAPMGIPPSAVEVLVFHGRKAVRELAVDGIEELRRWVGAFRNPLYRVMFRLSMSREMMNDMREFVIPASRFMVERFDRDGADKLTYDPPALLLFHVSRDSHGGYEDAYIAATYAMLAAEALGLGTIMLGMIPACVEYSKPLKRKYGIRARNKVAIALAVGYPKMKYLRTIKRTLRDVKWRA